MFTAEQITFHSKSKTILHATSASFERGRVYGIIGHNGSGKSTFIKLLAKQQSISSGQIKIDDVVLSKLKNKHFAQKVSYLPQYLPNEVQLTAYELVKLGRFPWLGTLKKFGLEDEHQVERAFKQTNTCPFKSVFLPLLSGGERQRIWLAMCLAQNTPYLILDEPLSALDIHHQIEIMKLLQTLAHQNKMGIIVVLHDINLASEFCDEILAFKQGHLIYNEPAHSFMNQARLKDIYDLDFSVVSHPARPHFIAIA